MTLVICGIFLKNGKNEHIYKTKIVTDVEKKKNLNLPGSEASEG